MALIKEPKGVDFLIQSPPLTNEERKEISKFIRLSKNSKQLVKKKAIKEKETA